MLGHPSGEVIIRRSIIGLPQVSTVSCADSLTVLSGTCAEPARTERPDADIRYLAVTNITSVQILVSIL